MKLLKLSIYVLKKAQFQIIKLRYLAELYIYPWLDKQFLLSFSAMTPAKALDNTSDFYHPDNNRKAWVQFDLG